ncbi:SOS response-associated peptidase [Phytohabitans rumicis]
MAMCGRYATTRSAADLSALFEAYDDTVGALAPDYNVAPTDPAPIVRMSQSAGGRVLTAARWGLVPPWAKDAKGAARMINARAETVASSSAYSSSFAKRRCLVPIDGWYEWVRRPDGRKQAYFMTPAHGSVLALAGIWAPWSDRLTYSVVTTAAIGDLALVHDRMPLLLPWQRWAAWLESEAEPEALLAAPSDEFLAELEIRPVGPAVGDVRNDGPDLVRRAPETVPLAGPPDEPIELTLF